MASRRKTKSQRELVADIRKSHMIFCKEQENCRKCPIFETDKNNGCIIEYVKMLLVPDTEE